MANRVVATLGIRLEVSGPRPGEIIEQITEIITPATVLDMQYKTSDSLKTYNESYPLYNTKVSVIENDMLKDNLPNIVYIILNGIKFSIENIREQHPRIEIELGGFYNG